MADFADFQQVDSNTNVDPFAGAMGGMQMNAQVDMGDLGAFAAAPALPGMDDYTEEELAMIQKTELENDARKQALFEKQKAETTEKTERKMKGQQWLADWKARTDGIT